MSFYENTIIARQDLAENELKELKHKNSKTITDTSGKVLKIEEWGLLHLATKIKKYRKGIFIHYKFEGNESTLSEIKKKIKIDKQIIRHLLVKFKKLDLEKKFFEN